MSRRAISALLCSALLGWALIAVSTTTAAAAPESASTSRAAHQEVAGAADVITPHEKRQLSLLVRNAMTDDRLPAVAVGVWVPRGGSYVESFGIADRTTGREARIRDHVRIASITKTFTATAVLQLVDQRLLSLDDRLSAFYPQVDNADTITIRQMLHMSSGIYDFTADPDFVQAFYADPTMPFEEADFFEILARHDPAFAPGDEVVYSDSNYWLLGLIVERVTGKALGQAIEDGILEPLGLKDTSYPMSPALPEPYARGYFGGLTFTDPLTDATAVNPAVGSGAGAMVSTLRDLRVWAKARWPPARCSPGTSGGAAAVRALHWTQPARLRRVRPQGSSSSTR